MKRVITLLLVFSASTFAQEVKISVGPNYLVSRDGDVPHAETMIAANPWDPKNLVGGAITATRAGGGWACRAYATKDGGLTWRYSDFPEQVEFGGADPQVVFTPDGTAVFLSLASGGVVDDEGKTRGGMAVYRSSDGGFTWERGQNICCSHDHPQMVVDSTMGRFAGRIYVGTLWDYPVYRIGVFRSDDGGRTFTGPVEAVNGAGILGVNVVSTGVMSDGTLVVPYVDFEYLPEKRKTKGKVTMNSWLVMSNDGGITFSKPVKTHPIVADLDQRESIGMPFTAVDISGKHPNNLYMVWNDASTGPVRVLFSRSTDRAKSWSKPAPIASDVPAHTKQYQPTITVNKDGVVGVTWFDTRHSPDGSQYHMYFTASVDGGMSFLTPVRVTTEPSIWRGRGNARPMGSTFEMGEVGMLSLLSAANRWPTGGDYLGHTANRQGIFYPFWTDARTGTFQLYTSPIRVTLPPTAEQKKRKEALAVYYGPEKAGPDPARRIEVPLLGKVELVFDPTTTHDDASELWVRLKNKSETLIYGPVRLEVVGVGYPPDDTYKEYAPQILNAPNGKSGIGAEFVFDLGEEGVLRPNSMTGAIPIRVREVDITRTPPLRYKIFGKIDPPN